MITDPDGNQSYGMRVKDSTSNVEYFLPKDLADELTVLHRQTPGSIYKIEDGVMKIKQGFIDTGIKDGALKMYDPPESDADPSPRNTSTVPPVNQRFDRSGFATSTRNYSAKDLPSKTL